MALTIGQKLRGGKYSIETELGRGRFGITYLARDRNGNGHVIKTLNDQVLNDPSKFERWQRNFAEEAFKLAMCKHPHIVEVEEPFQEAGLWCIAMEYIEGRNLAHRAQGKLPEAEALRYIQQIGEALTIVHQNNLVHRDVKPANIMIRAGSTEAVLIDFGLARGFDQKLSVSNLETEAEAGFTPPELYSETKDKGPYTDIYSLAATLYNLLTGQIPTSAKERVQYNTPLKPPKKWNQLLSDRTDRAILWAMELDGKNRPQSIQAWLDELGLKTEPVANPKPNSESASMEHLARTQTRFGVLSFWAAVVIGVLGIAVTIAVTVFGDDIKQIIIKPSPSPSSLSVPKNP